MKARNILAAISTGLCASIYLSSCGVDRWAGYAEQTQTDRWIDDTMRVWYYWREDIPNTNDLNYFQDPVTFFNSLLSSEDGKNSTPYSTIDTLQVVTRSIPYTDYSYGFQFTTNQAEDNDTALYAHILYVIPGSPASDIDLERGEWILAMDGEPITSSNYTRLYGSTGMALTVGYYDTERDTILAYENPRQIAGARSIDDNPVHYRNVYNKSGHRIGYLVYNHFSAGMTDGSDEYDKDLREAFRDFASQQVDEFILDLRYNNGGQLSCVDLLCAMLAPSSALGQSLGYLEFNMRFTPRQTKLYFDADLIQDGANLNLSTLYVLTSSETASASEMLINCLKPYMDVILVGSTTEGKNVGSTTFTNTELGIAMHPIVCKIYNAEGASDYEEGFSADVSVSENDDWSTFLPFGNEKERMLDTALNLIDNSETSGTSAASSTRISTVQSSVSRRGAFSVRIR